MRWTILLLTVGVLMLIGSFIWSRESDDNRLYLNADAEEFQAATAAWNNAIHSSGDQSQAADGHEDHEQTESAALEAARTRLDTLRSRRDAAHSRRASRAGALKWGGIACLLAGIGAYGFNRNRA